MKLLTESVVRSSNNFIPENEIALIMFRLKCYDLGLAERRYGLNRIEYRLGYN